MPRSCAFGCKPQAGVAMHRFPSNDKFPERFKTWVTLCRGKLETSADYYNYTNKRVCDWHFVEKDRNRNKRLNALAVPSLYLAGIPQCTDRGSLCQTSTSLQTNTEIPLPQALEPEMKNLATSSPKSIDTEIALPQALEPEMKNLATSSPKSIDTEIPLPQALEPEMKNLARSSPKLINTEISLLEALKPEMKNLARSSPKSINTEIPLLQALEPEMKNLATSSPKSIDTGESSGIADTELSYVLREHNYCAASRERQLASKKHPKKTQRFNCAQVSYIHTEIKQLHSEICCLKKRVKQLQHQLQISSEP